MQKTIAYGWFGKGRKPQAVLDCIDSWKLNCPGFEILELNEDYAQAVPPSFVQDAYNQRMWAYVSDYYRMDFMYRHGGITLDADVEVLKPLDKFLDHQFFSGQEINNSIKITATMGSEPRHPFIGMILNYYELVPFVAKPNTMFITGLLDVIGTTRHPDGTLTFPQGVLYPQEVFCPYDHKQRRHTATDATYTIHHFHGSWIRGRNV